MNYTITTSYNDKISVGKKQGQLAIKAIEAGNEHILIDGNLIKTSAIRSITKNPNSEADILRTMNQIKSPEPKLGKGYAKWQELGKQLKSRTK